MAILDALEIMQLIPNRYPINYIDSVTEFEPDKRIVAIKNLTVNETFVKSYLENSLVMPNTLIIEALAQTSSILILKSPKFVDKTAYLGAVRQASFNGFAKAGDQITFEVELTKVRENMGTVKTIAKTANGIICEAELSFVVANRDEKLVKK